MGHPLEAIIREAYAAFGRGDVDGYLRPCTHDFVFNVPGHSAITGTYEGKEGLYALAGKAMEITAGTFHEDVEDALAAREGLLKDYRTAHVYAIREGRLAKCWEQPQDPASFEDAWGPGI